MVTDFGVNSPTNTLAPVTDDVNHPEIDQSTGLSDQAKLIEIDSPTFKENEPTTTEDLDLIRDLEVSQSSEEEDTLPQITPGQVTPEEVKPTPESSSLRECSLMVFQLLRLTICRILYV